MSKTFLETIVILSLRWRGVAGKKLCKQLVGPWCHEKCPSPPFTARPAAGTILATLWSYTLWNIVHFHKSSTQGALSLLEESPVIVCNAQFYTIPIVQAIEQECIAHRQCAVTQNNERFCRGGLSGAVTITGGGVARVECCSPAKYIDGIPVVSGQHYYQHSPLCYNVFPGRNRAVDRMWRTALM